MSEQSQQSQARSALSWEMSQTIGKKLHGQHNPDFTQARSELNALIVEWFGKSSKDMSIDELWEAHRRVRKLGDVLQRSKESE